MEPKLEPGARITVIRRARPPLQHPGVICANRGTALAVRFDAPMEWSSNDQVLLIAGTPTARLSAPGTFVAAQGEVVAFALAAAWKPLDLGPIRAPLPEVTAEVRSVLGQSRQQGRVTDISLGGASVVVPTKPGGNTVELMIASGGFTAHVRCDIVSAIPEAEGVTLNLRYRELPPAQLAFVRQLMASGSPEDEPSTPR